LHPLRVLLPHLLFSKVLFYYGEAVQRQWEALIMQEAPISWTMCHPQPC